MEEVLKQRWLQMGVELEGSWNKSRREVAASVRGAKEVVDRSVHIGHGDPGEIITRPHADIEALMGDIRALYPDHVHTTCGFHIHASFTPMDMSMIATSEFYTYFKEEWVRWGNKQKLPKTHEFWNRLAGSNKNARDEFKPEVQLQGDGKGTGGKGGQARYTMLNFYSWEVHRTVECRLLPMFAEKEVAISALNHLSYIYNSWLNKHGFKTLTFEPANQLVGERALERYESQIPELSHRAFEAHGTFPQLAVGENVFYSIAGATDDMLPFTVDTGKTLA